MDSATFREAGHDLIDWIANYYETVEQYPVLSQVRPGEVAAQIPLHPPEHPEKFGDVFADLDSFIREGTTHWQSPNWFAYFPSNVTFASILGDLASSGLGANGFSWATSPAITEVETRVMDWMRELLNLPNHFTGNGVIQDSASSATLCAILAARTRAMADPGCEELNKLVAYSTAQAHSSIEKGLRIAGIPQDNLRIVAHDEMFAMDPSSLADLVASDIAAGLVPFFVCATAGTTSTEACDPIDDVAEVTTQLGIWLHVDAAMCGIAALCEEFRWIHRGVEHADSYVTDAHKWLGVGFDCSLFWVAERTWLLNALSILPAYLRTKELEEGAVIDYRDWQIPLGRRFRALKLWFVLRVEGSESLRKMIRTHCEWTTDLANLIVSDPRFSVTAPVKLNLICLRLNDSDTDTAEVAERINRSGVAQLTTTVVDGSTMLRICIGSRLTEKRHVLALWSRLQSTADGMAGTEGATSP
jgi:aromatic-L-amino-acid decarboxylase